MNPYKILEISEDSDESQIKNAFRNKAKILHPDISKNEDDSEFKLLLEAYEILKNNHWDCNTNTNSDKPNVDELFDEFIRKYPTYRDFSIFSDDIIKSQLKWSSLRNRP
tara:strand:+ start:81 stop:407 length:327 start_codon:yes stop_codon:yes gene_type:complete